MLLIVAAHLLLRVMRRTLLHITSKIAQKINYKNYGGNDFDQLGYGDLNNRGDAGGELGDDLPLVVGLFGRSWIPLIFELGHSYIHNLISNAIVKLL